MPFFAPIENTEFDQYRESIRGAAINLGNVAYQLTTEQLLSTPTVSELSIGALLQHVGQVCVDWTARAAAGPDLPVEEEAANRKTQGLGSHWIFPPGATAESIVSQYQERVEEALSVLSGLDPTTPVPVPINSPWYPPAMPVLNVRFVCIHLLNEIVRHSGQADIIRETIDGKTMHEIIAAAESIDTTYIDDWFAVNFGAHSPADQ